MLGSAIKQECACDKYRVRSVCTNTVRRRFEKAIAVITGYARRQVSVEGDCFARTTKSSRLGVIIATGVDTIFYRVLQYCVQVRPIGHVNAAPYPKPLTRERGMDGPVDFRTLDDRCRSRAYGTRRFRGRFRS